MDTEKIVQDLNRRFSLPLPEFYDRRIIFWYDEEREFEDKLDEIKLNNAEIIVMTGKNNFAVKKQIAVDDKKSNFLVYCPVSYERPDDNWILNIELYSEEFRADLNSIWMDEMGLPSSAVLRNLIRQYKKFFNAKDRRARFAALNNNITTATQLHLAVMAAICGAKDTQPNSIIKSVLSSGLDNNANPVYSDLESFGAANPFWIMVAQATGYKSEDPKIGELACHILLTAMTRTLRFEYVKVLGSYISIPHQTYCYDFVFDWLHSDECGRLLPIARFVEENTQLIKRFSLLDVETLMDTEVFPCIDDTILRKVMKDIEDDIINVDLIKTVVEKRRAMTWFSMTEPYFDCLLQTSKMQEFYLAHASDFHTVEPKKIWESYTKDYYRMDTCYRLFHEAYNRCLKVSDQLLDDHLKAVADKVEGLYSVWFLGSLASEWTTAAEDDLVKYGRILDIPQQESFYKDHASSDDNRVFVIISDAMRYEVGASLAEQLRRETQAEVKLDSCEAIFPTITKFGMAALLPHEEMTVSPKANGELGVFVDGVSADAGYRDKILKNAEPDSVALKYTDIINLKRAERQSLVNGMRVIYIYHDKIDETAHSSDTKVFDACDEAIDEIKNLVKIIVNDFSGFHICITADHGFLYTFRALEETDKVGKLGFDGKETESGRRYAILEKGAEPEYLMKVNFLGGNTDYDGFAPKENIRLKSGGGLNFVHGGISLQEMVVPVIDYHFLRNSNSTYRKNKDKFDTKPVSLSLLSASHKISNMIFSLNFYQKEAVGDNREAANFSVYFTDAAGSQISDVVRVIADKTSENSQERTFRCTFNLKPISFSNMDTYYLVIEDESGMQESVKTEFSIDIAFAVDDFNFFG